MTWMERARVTYITQKVRALERDVKLFGGDRASLRIRTGKQVPQTGDWDAYGTHANPKIFFFT